MKIAISAESTIDLTKELLIKYDIKTLPFTLLLGDKDYLDGEIGPLEIIDFVNNNKILPKTSAVNEYQYNEHFQNILKDYDAIVHFSLSSKLSVAYQNAVKASKKFDNVFVLDTKTLSTGIALLAIYGRELADKGLSPKEIFEKCNMRVPYVQASFELKRLDYLYKGGRCSALSFIGASVFSIRPQIILEDGKMVPGKKYRGKYEYVVKKYCNDVLEQYDNPDYSLAFVTYTTAKAELTEYVVNLLRDKGFKNVYVTRAGGTITSHCGEDCLGILYMNDGKN